MVKRNEQYGRCHIEAVELQRRVLTNAVKKSLLQGMLGLDAMEHLMKTSAEPQMGQDGLAVAATARMESGEESNGDTLQNPIG